MDTIARDHQIRLVAAFIARAKTDPTVDVHAGLCALVGHVQGDELDADGRAMLASLTGDVLAGYVTSVNA